MQNSPPGQLKKILDINTPRKKSLSSIYKMTVDISRMLDISDKEKNEVFLNMLEVTKKLAKVADAVDEYIKIEEEEIKKIVKEVVKHNNPSLILAEDSSRLEALVEEVLSQSKSALDVVVKILKPILGIKLNTFGGGGKSVIKALNQNVPKKYSEKAGYLVEMLQNEGDWIDIIKKYRDDQHYKNLGISPLRANAEGESESPRMPGGQLVSETLEIIYVNLYTFIMDFMALAMLIKLYPGLGLAPEGEGLDKKVRPGIVNINVPNNRQAQAK